MVNVSKQAVADTVRAQMRAHFSELFVLRMSKKEVAKILDEILTPAEQATVVKRVAAIGMLAGGREVRDIARTLSLSTRTVLNFKHRMHKKEFPLLWNMYKKIPKSFCDFLTRTGLSQSIRASLQKEPVV